MALYAETFEGLLKGSSPSACLKGGLGQKHVSRQRNPVASLQVLFGYRRRNDGTSIRLLVTQGLSRVERDATVYFHHIC